MVPAASICHVVHEEQVGELNLSRDNLERLLASGSFFWLDLPRPGRRTSRSCARSSGSIRSRSRTRSTSASGRSSRTTTTSSSWSSTAPSPTRTGWSRCTASTPSASSSPSTATRRRPSPRSGGATRSAGRRSTTRRCCCYRIVDALVDSFFPILADFDDRIDELENQTFLHASDEQLQEIFAHEAAARRDAQGGDARSATCSPV